MGVISKPPFHGRKGDGGSGSGANLTADTLRSADTYEIILGISEGPIAGPESLTDAGSFFIGDTPVGNPDGSSNFYDANINFFDGQHLPNYKITPIMGGSAASTNVSTTLYQGLPVVRTTQSGDINFIDVRLDINTLYATDSSGNTSTANFDYKIEWKLSSDSIWTTAVSQSLNGKTTTTYVKQIRIKVTPTPNDTFDVRVTKLSPESSNYFFCLVNWESMIAIKTDTYTWPGTSVLQLWGRATNQFNSLPQFSGVYKGRVIRVPTNYDPVAKTYSGVWDGTFHLAYTDNPAWCLYDFLTDTTYGIGAYYPLNIDKFSVYAAAVWCDDRMSDGSCRYTYNDLISTQRSGRDQAVYMAGVFNGVIFDDGNGTAYLRIDKDDQALHLFAEENTTNGFQYSFSDLSTRYNSVTVHFINPDLNWEQDSRRVEDPDDIAINGRVPLDFTAVGCISVAEAMNRARYKMVTSLTECMQVTFQTNRQGNYVAPWDVMLISDPSVGYAVSGRIKSVDATGRVITLRDPIYLEAGQTYQINIDNTSGNGPFVATIVNPLVGNNTTLTLSAALPAGTPSHAVFSLQGGQLGLPKPFRVLKIEEVDGTPDNIRITGVEMNRNKWTAIDSGTVIQPPNYSQVNNAILAPTNLDIEQNVISTSAGTRINLDVSWTDSASKWVTDYQVTYSFNGGSPTTFTTDGDNQAVIANVVVGSYTVSVRALGFGVSSAPVTVTFEVDPNGVKLAAVTGLELSGAGNSTTFNGKDAKFDWRFNAAYGGKEPLGSETGSGAGYLDPWFQCFEVTIFDGNGNARRTEKVTVPSYNYTYEKNCEDGGPAGPSRELVIQVVWHDNFGRVSEPAKLAVSNPAPGLPTSIAVSSSFKSVFVSWTNAPDLDFAGTRVWCSTDPHFTPTNANLKYDGPDTFVAIPADTGTTYYVILASYDSFGSYELNYTGSLQSTTAAIEGPDIAQGIIDHSKLNQDLQTVLTDASSAVEVLTDLQNHEYTVKIDNNGYIAGYGLINGGPGQSQFIVRADTFAIGSPGSSPVFPFIVQGGKVYMDAGQVEIQNLKVGTAQIGTASIDHAMIADAAIWTSNIQDGAVSTVNVAQIGTINGNGGNFVLVASVQFTLAASSNALVWASFLQNQPNGESNSQFYVVVDGHTGPVYHTGVDWDQTPSYTWATGKLAPGSHVAQLYWSNAGSGSQVVNGTLLVMALQK